MSHVTDGDLHAWLDGALEELGDAEAERVRTHLDGCELCRRRLEEERRIREGAGRILSAASPDVRLPTLEELRSVAVARETRVRSARRIQRVAWAASVMVALGTGWMLRGEWSAVAPRASRSPTAVPSVKLQEMPAAAEARSASDADGSQAVGRATGGAEPPATSIAAERKVETPVEKGKVETPNKMRAADQRGVVAEAEVSPESASPAAAAPPKRDSGAAAEKIPVAALAENVTIADTSSKVTALRIPRTDSIPNVISPQFVRQTGAGDTAALRDVMQISNEAAGVAAARPAAKEAAQEAGGAETRLESSGSLAVPGLVVLSVTRLDAGGVPGGVRVLQLLSSGDTLELEHLPPTRAPRVTDQSARGLTELTIPQADGWLIARAKLPRDSLQALVDRLQGR